MRKLDPWEDEDDARRCSNCSEQYMVSEEGDDDRCGPCAFQHQEENYRKRISEESSAVQ